MKIKKMKSKIAALLMAYVAVKGIFFVTADNGFHYNGLPMWVVYVMLTVFCAGSAYLLFRAFIRKSVQQ